MVNIRHSHMRATHLQSLHASSLHFFLQKKWKKDAAEHQSRPSTWQPTQAASRPSKRHSPKTSWTLGVSPSTPPDTHFSRSEQAKAHALHMQTTTPTKVSTLALPLSAAQEVRFSPALWRVVSRRRRSPPTTALLLPQRGPLTSPFGQVSRAPDKSVLSFSVQRLSQELCHHPSTRTQGWHRQPTERRHGVAAYQQQSRTGVHH